MYHYVESIAYCATIFHFMTNARRKNEGCDACRKYHGGCNSMVGLPALLSLKNKKGKNGKLPIVLHKQFVSIYYSGLVPP